MYNFTVLSVSQLNRFVKSVIDSQELLKEAYVKGEISNLNNHFSSGHLYFSLKDQQSTVKCVMFSQYAGSMPFRPQNGMSVIIRGDVSVYERDGVYQLYVHDMQPDGVGAAYVAFEQTKARLEAAGVFSPAQKRPIPPFPRHIGVITSKSGAAFQDIINIITRRYPAASLLFCPAVVQGAEAEASLLNALATLNADGRADVILLCRGGGSLEDLAAFNSEKLAYGIRASRIPVVTGVGHEIDASICDFAADVWAPTPSAAAELATPDMSQLLERLMSLKIRLGRVMAARVEGQKEMLQDRQERIYAKHPTFFLNTNRQRLHFLVELLQDRYKDVLSCKNIQWKQYARLLGDLGPLKVLERGYSITQKNGKAITRADSLAQGDAIVTLLHRGKIHSQIIRIEGEGEGKPYEP